MTDRELDRQVAEQVMGWNDKDSIYQLQDKWSGQHRLWSPTTDPAAWMQVVETMREKGFGVNLGGEECDGWSWYAGFFKDNKCVASQVSNSLGESICLAALHAVQEPSTP